MADPEGNNNWTLNLHGKGKILPEQFNNEWSAISEPGVQAAIREILHSRESAMILMDSGTGNLAPTGTYASCNVANGYIMTRNSDGLSRVVLCAAATALNISTVAKCVVASNNGVISVKDKTSVLSTDVIIAIRGSGDDALVDVRNLKTEDDILTPNISATSIRIIGNTQVYKVGVDAAGYRTIILKNGDDLSNAITALGGAGTVILLPGTYTDSFTLSSVVSIIGYGAGISTIVGTITVSSAGCSIRDVTITGNITSTVGMSIIRCDIVSTNVDAVAQTGTDTSTTMIDSCNITVSSGNYRCVEIISIGPLNVRNCRMVASAGSGLYYNLGGYGGASISGCNINVKYIGIEYDIYDRVLISGCFIQVLDETGGYGILGPADGNSSALITGCSVNGKFKIGIHDGGHVIGCCISSANSAGSSDAGIDITKSLYTCVVANNFINGNGTRAITKGIIAPIASSNILFLCSTYIDAGKKHANVENGTFVHGDLT